MMKDRALILFRFYLYCARWTRYDYVWKAANVFGLYENTEEEKKTLELDIQHYIDTNELLLEVRNEEGPENRYIGLNFDNILVHH